MKTIVEYFVLGLAVLVAATGQANAVTITFDTLPCNTYVTNQYPQVSFSSNAFNTPITYCDNNYGTTLPSLTRRDFYGWNHFAELTLNFTRPVKDLTFHTIGVDNGGVIANIDIYRSGILSQTVPLVSNGSTFIPTFVDLSQYGNDITRIRIYNISDPYGIAFDNFSFTPYYLDITNPRVSNITNGSTQNALVGGDVNLVATASTSGGSYSWVFQGTQGVDYDIVSGGTNSSALIVRWRKPGSYLATANYAGTGGNISAQITINTKVPTLSEFTASAVGNVLDRGNGCSGTFYGGTTYTMGCYHLGGQETGIVWSATAVIDNLTYLSDPAQSGIKFKNGASVFNKRLNNGRIECRTLRTPNDSGWALDTFDPYNHPEHPSRFFNQGNSLVMGDFDAPGTHLDGTPPNGTSFFYDAKVVDDLYETYVFFFAGDPGSPTFEYPQPLRLTNSQYLTDRIVWKFGGTVYFDLDGPAKWLELPGSSTTTTGQISATGTNSIVNLQRTITATQPPFSLCPGAVNTTNPIDGTRFFVNQLYADLLGYPPDPGGWDFWTMQITRCVFDTNCIYGVTGRRTALAQEFFNYASFNQTDPAMANPPGSPGFDPAVYNPAFVNHCYLSFLQRNPDPGGHSFWVSVLNSTGDYRGVIHEFTTTPEYRMRNGGAADPHY